MQAVKGQIYDAIKNKRSNCVRDLHRRVDGGVTRSFTPTTDRRTTTATYDLKGRTKLGNNRNCPTKFIPHHVQRISKAVVYRRRARAGAAYRISSEELITPPQITLTPVDSSRSDAAAFKGTPDSPQNTKKPAPRHSDSARYELAKLGKMEVAWSSWRYAMDALARKALLSLSNRRPLGSEPVTRACSISMGDRLMTDGIGPGRINGTLGTRTFERLCARKSHTRTRFLTPSPPTR